MIDQLALLFDGIDLVFVMIKAIEELQQRKLIVRFNKTLEITCKLWKPKFARFKWNHKREVNELQVNRIVGIKLSGFINTKQQATR